nr:unnamed protein product [Callosobruchus analis]
MHNYSIKNSLTIDDATRVTSNTSTIIDHVIACHQTKNFCSVSVKNNPLSDHNRLNIIIKQKIKIYQKKCTYESLSMSHKKFVSLFEKKCESIGINSFQQLIQTVQTCKQSSVICKMIKCHENNKWVNDELLQMIKERNKLYDRKKANEMMLTLKLNLS